MSQVNKISVEAARSMLWEQGNLTWKLRSHQVKLHQSYLDCNEKVVVWNCSRRLGKSNTLCIIAIETCLKTPYSIVKYCCAKQKDARNIIREVIRPLIEDCPAHLKPEYKTQEGMWVFPNGSIIQITGLDGGRAESVRGGSSHLAIIDEAGLVKDLPYIMTSIILPTTATTKGKIILASTPPRSPSHPYITRYLNKARIQGNLVTMTIYDNPYIDPDELKLIIDESGGVDSTDFQREYLCNIIKDENYAIVPEFNPATKVAIVKEWERKPFYDAYVAMDIGVKDLTVVLFAWVDFVANKIIVEDEFVLNGQKFNTNSLAQGIKDKEALNFTDKITGESRTPTLRVSDTTLTVINDLWTSHGIRFLPTRKDDADAALNKVRLMIQNEQIIINPRCKTLIMHLENGIWNKNKTSFERSVEGHFDAIDALKYLIRNADINRNPFPKGYLDRYNSNKFEWNDNKPKDGGQWGKVFNIQPSTQDNKKEIVKIFNKAVKRY
jgi:hypothetical protein